MSIMTQPVDRFQAALSHCYHWQRLKDAGSPWTPATALAHSYKGGLPEPANKTYTLSELQALRPFALVWIDNAGGFSLDSLAGASTCAKPGGILVCQLEFDVPDTLTTPDAVEQWWMEQVGNIWLTGNASEPGLLDLSPQPDYLPIWKLDLKGMARTSPRDAKTLGDALKVEFEVSWGIE